MNENELTILMAINILQEFFDEYGDLPLWIEAEWTEPVKQGKWSGFHYQSGHKQTTGKRIEIFPARVGIS